MVKTVVRANPTAQQLAVVMVLHLESSISHICSERGIAGFDQTNTTCTWLQLLHNMCLY